MQTRVQVWNHGDEHVNVWAEMLNDTLGQIVIAPEGDDNTATLLFTYLGKAIDHTGERRRNIVDTLRRLAEAAEILATKFEEEA